MSYLSRVCGGRNGCGVAERVKCSTLIWFGHIDRMSGSEITKREYIGKAEAVGVRGRLTVQWEGRVVEYVKERRERGD